MHPVVDALAQALSSAESLERSVACALCAALAQRRLQRRGRRPGCRREGGARRARSRWRLRLESFACATPASKLRHGPDGTRPTPPRWRDSRWRIRCISRSRWRLRADPPASVRRGSSSPSPSPLTPPRTTRARAWEAWQHAAGRVNVALGIPPATAPFPPALLWRLGGHRLVPRTEGLRRAEDRVRFLCAALRPGRTTSSSPPPPPRRSAREATEHDRSTRVASAAMERATLAAATPSAATGAPVSNPPRSRVCASSRGRTWAAGYGVAPTRTARTRGRFSRERNATIPAQIADECSKLAAAAAAAAAPTPTLGKGEEVGGGDDAMAVDTFVRTDRRARTPAPREYDLNSFSFSGPPTCSRGSTAPEESETPAPLGFPVWSQRFAKCRVAHGSLLPLLELHSIASQMTLLEVVSTRLARVSLASTVESTPLTKETTRARLTADELAAAARSLSFGVAAAPRDPADFAAHRHLLWLARADSGDDRLAESVPSPRARDVEVVARLGVGGVLDEIPAALQPKLRAKRSETVSPRRFRSRVDARGGVLEHAARGPVAASAPPQPSSPSPSSRPTGAWTAWRRDRRGRFSSGWRLERSA